MTEKNKYSNNCIKEVLFEVRFSDDFGWDNTLPGLLKPKINEGYPQIETHHNFSITVPMVIQNSKVPQVTHEQSSVSTRFINIEKDRFFQVSPKNLVIHRKGYQGWSDFKAQIGELLDHTSDLIPEVSISRLGLKYFNEISLNQADEFSDYFNIDAGVNPQGYKQIEFLTRSILQKEFGEVLIFESNFRNAGDETYQVNFNFDSIRVFDPVIKMSEIYDLIDRMHEFAYDSFESKIRQNLRTRIQ